MRLHRVRAVDTDVEATVGRAEIDSLLRLRRIEGDQARASDLIAAAAEHVHVRELRVSPHIELFSQRPHDFRLAGLRAGATAWAWIVAASANGDTSQRDHEQRRSSHKSLSQ